MVDAQGWVDAYYRRTQRWDIEQLDLTNLNLEGNLDLRTFYGLRKVDISGNPRLTGLRTNPGVEVIRNQFSAVPAERIDNSRIVLLADELTRAKRLIQQLKLRVAELENELETEREEAADHAERMDNFYRQNPPKEDLMLKNILSEVSNDYLNAVQESKNQKVEIKRLEKSLQLLNEMAEQERKKIENKEKSLRASLRRCGEKEHRLNEMLKKNLELQNELKQKEMQIGQWNKEKAKQDLLEAKISSLENHNSLINEELNKKKQTHEQEKIFLKQQIQQLVEKDQQNQRAIELLHQQRQFSQQNSTVLEEQVKKLQQHNQLNEQMKLLVDSAKYKLRSNSVLVSANQERSKKLDTIFSKFPTTLKEFIESLESIKSGLSKRLTELEINDLYQTNQELIQLKFDQQTFSQVQVPPKGNN